MEITEVVTPFITILPPVFVDSSNSVTSVIVGFATARASRSVPFPLIAAAMAIALALESW